MSRIQPLFALQQVDSAIDAHNASVANINATLADTTPIDNARQALSTAEEDLRKARSSQRELEYESEATEKHAQDLEKKLYGGQIKGAKEMSSAQTEIQTFRQKRKELDDQGVEAMVATEEAEALLKTAKEKLAATEAEWERGTEALRQERERLLGELVTLNAEREKAAKKVLSGDITIYEKLRTQKQGVAVAEVMMGKLCGKCRVDFALAKQRELKSPMSMVFCPSCGRILYLK
jgi:predicted  nucleic acid-binding Zn-ribbon protein